MDISRVKFQEFCNKNFKAVFFVFLIIFGIVNFWDSFKNPFFIDDSDHYLNARKQNPKFFLYDFVPNLTSHSGFENFENRWPYYRPLAHFLLGVESSYFNSDPFPYQVISLSFFILACYTIFLLLFNLTSNRFLSTAASLLYLLHPFNGLCVNYKTAVVFSLQIIFLNLIFVYVYKLFEKKNLFQWSQLLLYLVLYFFALLLHELAFIFPLILMMYCVFVKSINIQRIFVCLSFIFLAFFYFIMRAHFLGSSGGILGAMFGYKIAWWESCAAYARIIRWAFTKLVYPENIFIQWTTFVDKQMAGHWLWIFGFYMFIFIFFTWFFNKRSKLFVFFWLMFVLGFVLAAPPSYNSLGSGFFYFEPHWIFYTNIGLFALIGWFLDKLRIFKFWFSYTLLIVMIFFLGFFSFKQNRLFNNTEQYNLLWSQETPGFDLSTLSVCGDLAKHLKVNQAIGCYQSMTESSRRLSVYQALADLYFIKKDYKKSADFYNKVLVIDSTFTGAYKGLAIIAIKKEDYKKAINYLDVAQKYDIFALDLYIYRMYIYEKQKRFDKVLSILSSFENDYYVKDFAQLYRVKILFESKNVDQAIEISKQLIKNNRDFSLLFRLREILFLNKQYDLVEKAYRQAFLVDPKRALKLKTVSSKINK